MCGIAGIVDYKTGPRQEVVEKQLELLLHRGPDAKASYALGEGCIGQTRLSIIDLETGDPPITNESKSLAVALNGEIYNFQSLRDDLMAAGHSFRTRGDTEVIAHAAEQLDPVELARSLQGMFAFAVWDADRHRLILGRDRLGKKPLYYWAHGSHLVFASEIKALLVDPKVPRRLNVEALAPHLTLGYVPTPETFFDGVVSLPPGHVLILETGRSPSLLEYWRAPLPKAPADVLDLSLDEAAGETRRLLKRAVGRRLVADVPLGAFLSGGIDSSTIVGLMTELMDRPVSTFTIGFDDEHGFDERSHARVIAKTFGSVHTEFVVRPEAVELVEQLVWNYDQPFGDSSAIPTYLLARETKSHVKVALSGDGGDELFAGYERFAAALALHRFHHIPRPIRKLLARAATRSAPASPKSRLRSLQRFLSSGDLSLIDAFMGWQGYINRDVGQSLLGRAREGLARPRCLWDASDGADLLDRLLNLNLQSYLVDDLLQKTDRMSMAHGLEVRSPFLDHELVEFALCLPREARIRGLSFKRVLKAAVSDLLPKEIVTRRKKGFGVPLDQWFRGELESYAVSMLGSPSAHIKQHLAGPAVDAILAQHAQSKAQHGEAIWTLLTLEIFLRKQGW